jgi:hypothetical protein
MCLLPVFRWNPQGVSVLSPANLGNRLVAQFVRDQTNDASESVEFFETGQDKTLRIAGLSRRHLPNCLGDDLLLERRS